MVSPVSGLEIIRNYLASLVQYRNSNPRRSSNCSSGGIHTPKHGLINGRSHLLRQKQSEDVGVGVNP